MFNCAHHFYDDDGNGEMSMKEAFELKNVQKRKTLFAQVVVDPPSSTSPHCPRYDLQYSRFLSNSITMMGMLNYYGDADNDDSELILKMMMNTNGN